MTTVAGVKGINLTRQDVHVGFFVDILNEYT